MAPGVMALFTEHILCPNVVYFILPLDEHLEVGIVYLCFTDEETEVHETWVICARSWNEAGTALGWEVSLPDLKAQAFP